jgi:uncharacterized protein YbjT (DUF2867 family)
LRIDTNLKKTEDVMSGKKVIAVVGATGAQGGSVARAILNDKSSEFVVRALTRNAQSEKASELAKMGAEVVEANLDDKDSLVKAFEGAHGAFCVTFYWEHLSPEKEIAHATALAEAAKEARVSHVVWSTLEDTRKWVPIDDNRIPTLMKKYKVPHLDAKGESDKVFAELGVPTTYLLTSFFWENFIYFGMEPKKGQDGVLALTMPMGDKRLPGISTDDIGKCVYSIFRHGKEYIGKTVGIAGEHLTGDEMAKSFAKAIGQDVHYNAVEPDTYRSFGFPGADDLGNMFQFKRDFQEVYCGARSVDFTRKLDPELQTFDTWLSRNIARIPIEQN